MAGGYISTLSLRVKYAAVSGVVILALSVGLTWAFVWQTNRWLVQNLEQRGLSWVEELAADAASALGDRKQERIGQLLDKVFLESEVAYVGITDSQGKVVEERLRRPRFHEIPPSVLEWAERAVNPSSSTVVDRGGQTSYFFVTPVVDLAGSSTQRLGAVVLGISSHFLQRDIREIVKTALPISVGALIVSSLLVLFLIEKSLRPLADVARLTSDIAGGDFSQRIEVRRQDEVGQLASSFNAMADSLLRREAERKQAQEKLRTLNELARAMSSSLSTQEVFDFIVSSGAKLLSAKVVRLWIEDHASGGFTVHASYGVASELLKQTTTVPVIRPGEGVLGEVIETRTPEYILDAREEPRWLNKQMVKALGLVSVAAVPIIMGDRVLGVLTMMTGDRREFTEEEKDLLKGLADQAAVAIENARLYEETQRNLERIRALREIDKAITSTLDLPAVLEILMLKMDLVLPHSATTVRLFDRQSGLLEPVACRNLDEKEWKAREWTAGRGIPNVVFETKAPVRITNVQRDLRNKDAEFFTKHRLVSYLGVPLIVQDEVLGTLSFYTREEHQFSSEEIDFVTTIAGQAAVAIHNSQLYQEMIKLAADLSRSSRVKDEFLSVMSHELRTPLNVVMGYTGMIHDGLLGEINPEQERALEKVISRARDQLTMISSILQAVQMEAEGVKTEAREVDLEEFLDDLKLNYTLSSDKELNIVWDYPSDLPVISTDSEKLKHVLQNLINNAIKFTEKGTVTISARYLNESEGSRQQPEGGRQQVQGSNGNCVRFQVKDTGIGIASEHSAMIFERFRQVDSSETRQYGGVGMGLYIAKKFTEMLGGSIELESEVGKGSTFTVVIPVDGYQPAIGAQPSKGGRPLTKGLQETEV